MSFRQINDEKRVQQCLFDAWLSQNRNEVAMAGLPLCVVKSRDDWAYFLLHGYHDHGNWNTPPQTFIDFERSQLSPDQQCHLDELVKNWDSHIQVHPILARRLPSQPFG